MSLVGFGYGVVSKRPVRSERLAPASRSRVADSARSSMVALPRWVALPW